MTMFAASAVTILFLIISDTAATTANQEEAYLTAKPEDLEWFREARFGLFVCWGPVSLLGTEIGWSRGGLRRGMPNDDPHWGDLRNESLEGSPVEEYDNLYQRFNPTEFDADAWASLIKAAGMKYVIFLTKHHDGFCMFDTALTDYNIMNTPFQRDITKEIADACRKAGIRICWYYSQPDWHHPDYYTEYHQRYINYLHGQVRELLTNYGQIDVMWFDGLFCTEDMLAARKLMRMIRELQPGILINNRIGGLQGDFVTPEQSIGRYQEDPAWESCITMGTQWSWKPDDEIKSVTESLRILIRCAGGDGNLAYNVGPMPDGRIEPRQAQVLLGMGEWLKQYGHTIYATRGGPYLPDAWGASTRTGNTIYLHVMDWKRDQIVIPPMATKIMASRVITGGEATLTQNEEGITIRVAPEYHDDVATIIELELDGPASELKPLSLPSGSLATNKPTTASGVWSHEHGPELAVDDDATTRWASESGSRDAWLEVDLGTDSTLTRAVIDQVGWNRIAGFELQRRIGDSWDTFFTSEDTRLTGKIEVSFPPVVARHIRLNITHALDVPTIWAFQLFHD